jgi:hypothetical protein
MTEPPKEERALLEAIRSGKAPTIVKRQASRGVLPVAAEEMLEILVFLTKDPDPTCSDVAKQTLAGWPADKVAAALAQPETSAEALAYFAAQPTVPDGLVGVIGSHPNAGDDALTPLAPKLTLEQIQGIAASDERLALLPGLVTALLQRRDLPDELRTRLQTLEKQHAEEQAQLQAALAREEESDAKASPEQKRERMSLTQKVGRMSVAERVQFAARGDKDARLMLIRDPSKVVYRAVLSSPKLGDSEVEQFATMKNVAEEVLRIISTSRKFMKSSVVVRNLVNNPRTPIDVSLPLLARLTVNELKGVSTNRNVPETIRTSATKLFKQKTETKKDSGGH